MEEESKSIKIILGRYVDGLYTTNDLETLCHMLESEEKRRVIENEMERMWKEMPVVPLSKTESESYEKESRRLLDKMRIKKKKVGFPSFFKYAAILVCLFSIGFGIKYAWDDDRLHPKTEQSVIFTKVYVKHGENKKICLPDGTFVHLNAGTTLLYPEKFISGIRLVEIEGEAFFEVKKDENHPFVVRTEKAEIKVLGTSFDVKAYREDEQTAVSVRTGKVEVTMPESNVRLLPNEQLTFDHASGEMVKKNQDVKKATAWLQGGLYFNKTPIRQVMNELERIYDCKIVFAPDCLFEDYIYGEHDNKSLEAVLNAIRYSTGIRYKKEADRIVLYK